VVGPEDCKSEGGSRPASMNAAPVAGGSDAPEGGEGTGEGDRKSCSLVTQMADPGETLPHSSSMVCLMCHVLRIEVMQPRGDLAGQALIQECGPHAVFSKLN
jgi:hypothetical protein